MKTFLSREEILNRVRQKACFNYFPGIENRMLWEQLPEEKKMQLIREAEQAASEPVPFLSAADYLKFPREGNRISYETPYLRRRQLLAMLVLGEGAEFKGRFLDPITELLWQILAEPVWCWPAHQHLDGRLLPGPEDWVVDLFAGQTAKLLTDTFLLMGNVLEKNNLSSLNERIRHEINRRILEPVEKYSDETCFWYSGFNNWSVWCAYTVSSSALVFWNDRKERLANFLFQHMIPVQRFYNRYEKDGGCDEGPCYWALSVGMLFNYLNLIQHALGGLEETLRDPKLKAMADFLPGINLCGKYFLAFADTEPMLLKVPRGLFFQYGQLVGSPELQALALTLPSPDPALYRFGNRDSNFFDEAMADFAIAKDFRPELHHHAADFWEVRKICILRQNPDDPEKGTVCALKGGHNGESHNHLDLGHCTVFHNGKPVIIDIGRGTYNHQVFSDRRFEVWYIGSPGHNAARFDGAGQGIGTEFACSAALDGDLASYDLTAAYGKECGLRSYIRQMELDRTTGDVIFREKAEFAGRKQIDLRFYSTCVPEEITARSLQLGSMKMVCSNINIIHAGEYRYQDEKIGKLWGVLHTIDLQLTAEKSAVWEIRFKAV